MRRCQYKRAGLDFTLELLDNVQLLASYAHEPVQGSEFGPGLGIKPHEPGPQPPGTTSQV